jgi:hypothetical protein
LLDLLLLEDTELCKYLSQLPAALDEVRRVFELLLRNATMSDKHFAQPVIGLAGTSADGETRLEKNASFELRALTQQHPGLFVEIDFP